MRFTLVVDAGERLEAVEQSRGARAHQARRFAGDDPAVRQLDRCGGRAGLLGFFQRAAGTQGRMSGVRCR